MLLHFRSVSSPSYSQPFAVFFFHAPSPTALYTLSLHDALPILAPYLAGQTNHGSPGVDEFVRTHTRFHSIVASLAENKVLDRKSTRLNSSHRCISYAVFCLKKKKQKKKHTTKHTTQTNNRHYQP